MAADHDPDRLASVKDGLISALWASGTACMVITAIIFAASALFVKLMHGHVPVLEVRIQLPMAGPMQCLSYRVKRHRLCCDADGPVEMR